MCEVSAEEWRSIPDYPDYEVSDLGRIRRTTSRTCAKAGCFLKGCNREMYLAVDLCHEGKRRTFYIHRLVAAAFLSFDPERREVNHRNGNKHDNRLTNLEYVDRQENAQHAHDHWLQDCRGEKNGQAKLTADAALEIMRLFQQGTRKAELAGRFAVSLATVDNVLSGRRWRHITGIGGSK